MGADFRVCKKLGEDLGVPWYTEIEKLIKETGQNATEKLHQ
jgi:hypothetical protein